MKQGNPRKRFGIIALISAILNGIEQMPKETNRITLETQRSNLLTNYGRAPIPSKMLNQRQKRKRYRQSHTCK